MWQFVAIKMAGEGGALFTATNLLFGSMNFKPNAHRKLSFAEIESDHVYFATRHFPRISCSHGHRCSACKTTAMPDPERITKILGHRRERPVSVSSLFKLKELQRAPVTVENKLRGKLKELWDVKKEYHDEVMKVHASSLEKPDVKKAKFRIDQTHRWSREANTFQLRSKTGRR